MLTWSGRYLAEWRNSKEEVLLALVYMIDQYLFVSNPLTEEQRSALERELLDDWQTVRNYISSQRITTSARPYVDEETEALIVCLHCLAVITWEKLYNKFYPDYEEDVFDDTSAAVAAVEKLVRFGLVRETLRGGKWTPEGIDMLNGKLR